MPGAGIEPARPCDREILSLLCLPISPPGHNLHFIISFTNNDGGACRNRTGVYGFAGRCITTLLTRHVFLNKKGETTLTPPLFIKSGAGNEVRTRDLYLGKVSLYQLSYSRIRRQYFSDFYTCVNQERLRESY